LRPQPELCQMAGCCLEFHPRTGWHVPVRDEGMQTSVAGLFVAGDVCGIEEASIAMEEGEIAGTSAALYASGDTVGVPPRALFAARARLAELRGSLDRPRGAAV